MCDPSVYLSVGLYRGLSSKTLHFSPFIPLDYYRTLIGNRVPEVEHTGQLPKQPRTYRFGAIGATISVLPLPQIGRAML